VVTRYPRQLDAHPYWGTEHHTMVRKINDASPHRNLVEILSAAALGSRRQRPSSARSTPRTGASIAIARPTDRSPCTVSA
jgi:hypothetical protein